MSDWLDDLGPDERSAWDDFVDHVRKDTLQKMAASAFVASIVPKKGDVDVKFAVELGLAIMLDKPILAIVGPGAEVPERLRRVIDELVEADIDVQAGQATVAAAIQRMVEG